MPTIYASEKLIPILEAVFIEALEPRQNRRRGDYLGDFEYLQVVDKNLERRRAISSLQEIIEKGH